MEVKLIEFSPHGDERGQLIALEELKEIPFNIRRVYYMYKTVPDAVRGKHAHRSLQQVLICTSGSCKVRLDDGKEKREVLLDKPWQGLYISNVLWREMYDFSPDAVLMVLASDYYDEADYIRNYDDFLSFVKEQTGEENGQ